MPKTLLIRYADVLVTMDVARREIRDGAKLIDDHRIVAIGTTATLPSTADEVLDLTGHVVSRMEIATSQHLTRAVHVWTRIQVKSHGERPYRRVSPFFA